MKRLIWLTEASSASKGLDYCNRCGDCCRWGACKLVPGDAERIAEYLLMPLDEVKKLIEGQQHEEGIMVAPKLRNGVCVFLSGNECSIHPVKPTGGREYECWRAMGDSDHLVWTEEQIRELVEK